MAGAAKALRSKAGLEAGAMRAKARRFNMRISHSKRRFANLEC